MWKTLRVSVLLLVLVGVALGAWRDRRNATDWIGPLVVAVYPINADGSEVAERYLQTLDVERFEPVAAFIAAQGMRWQLPRTVPVDFRLAPRVNALPPPLPRSGNRLLVIIWSLRLRWWAWRHDTYTGQWKQVRMFLLYHDPARSPQLAHSTGLQKGLLGVVNLFASPGMNAQNNVVLAHELLHTVGATDKYDLSNGQPLYPDGFAEPAREPRYPQRYAEIMAGRVPVGPDEAEQAASLQRTVIGAKTAREIGWLR